MKDTKIVYQLVNTAISTINPPVVDELSMTPAEAVERNSMIRERNLPARWIRKTHNSSASAPTPIEESPSDPTKEPELIESKPHFTNEEFREVVRHIHLLIKQFGRYDSENFFGTSDCEAIQTAKNFLESKKYFNFNQSDLV